VSDGIGLAEKMLGRSGVIVVDVEEHPGEVVVRVESTRPRAVVRRVCDKWRPRTESMCTCGTCTALSGHAAWSSASAAGLSHQGLLQEDLDREAGRYRPAPGADRACWGRSDPPGGPALPSVASVAVEDGVGWDSAWAAVELHGRPLVDDPVWVRCVPWGSMSTPISRPPPSTRHHLRHWSGRSGPAHRDRSARRRTRRPAAALDGRTPSGLATWRQGRGARSDRHLPQRASPPPLPAVHVADPFHVTRVANRMVDQVCRRVQNQTLGHRGRTLDPLFRRRRATRRARPGEAHGRPAGR
jgi:hypothetical protein